MAQESRILSTAEELRARTGGPDSSQPMGFHIGHEIPQNTGVQQPPVRLSNEQQELSRPGNPDLETLSRPEPEPWQPLNTQFTGSRQLPQSPTPNAPSPVNAFPSLRITGQPQDLQKPPQPQLPKTLNPRSLNLDKPAVPTIPPAPPIEALTPSWGITESQQNTAPILEKAFALGSGDSANPEAQNMSSDEQASGRMLPLSEPTPTPSTFKQAASQSLQPMDWEGAEAVSATGTFGSVHGHEEKIREEDVMKEDVKLREQQEVVATQSEETLPSLDRGESPSTDSLSTLPSDGFDESSFTFQQAEKEAKVEFERDSGSDGILRLKPTLRQWKDFPSLLAFARSHNAELDGCFKIVLPDGALEALPEKPAQVVDANAFTPQLLRPSRIWRVNTKPTTGKFPSTSDIKESKFSGNATEAAKRLSKMFTKSKNRQIRDVRYRVDVPAWSVEQRLAAGVPGKSPLHPLKGDKLDLTKAIIPGIHTPYVYESGPAFGATFQLHAEDFRLSSLNHLYKGRKIWIIIPSAAVGLAEEKLGRKESCSQFMRHRAEFVFPEKLKRLDIPFRLIDQSPGETIVILPDAYHEGFSTGYTLAEAKNYAEETWNTETYQPCDASCQLATAIPGEFMRIIEDGEERLDLCSSYSDDSDDSSTKRDRDDGDSASDESVEERPVKKIKWKGGGMSSTVTSMVF